MAQDWRTPGGGGTGFTPHYPGAGFDELLGFTADPDWRMGRSQVEFPGENAAQKAFAEAWLPGEKSEDAVAQVQPPLYFNLGMRIGGHPCHYMPEGRQQLRNLARDVAVIGRHEDGNPLITYRKVGKGMLVLDGRSPDASGNSNLHLAAFHQAWLDEIQQCGLAPGGTGTTLLPVGEETLEQWFFAAVGGARNTPASR